MDRSVSRWEEGLFALTPFEEHGGVFFKREDYFAPLGYGGPNGSKLRQLVWLVDRGRRAGAQRLVSGASVKSPQLSMSTIVARHMGLEPEIIIGATNPQAAARHLNVQIAARFGARFRIEPVGYNPYLQSKVRQSRDARSMIVDYGISLPHDEHPATLVEEFHRLGADQVRGLPDDVHTLIVPAGSCNTLTSVLYGIALHRPRIDRLFTLGIGPDKLAWVDARLRVIESTTGLIIRDLFRRDWPQYREEAARQNPFGCPPPYRWEHVNIQANGFSTYHQEMRESHADIDFHPTYEGKMYRWLRTECPEILSSQSCFWIVGSEPQMSVIDRFAPLPTQKEVSLCSVE